MNTKYTIVWRDPDDKKTLLYWVCRCGATDNYTTTLSDATLFPDRSAAMSLLVALGLQDDGEHITMGVVPGDDELDIAQRVIDAMLKWRNDYGSAAQDLLDEGFTRKDLDSVGLDWLYDLANEGVK